jgi:hypothetical protein
LFNRQTAFKCPLTHYKETFKANFNVRKQSAYLPAPDNYRLAQVPMDLTTVQKTEFKPIKTYEKRAPIKFGEKEYVPPTEPFSTMTSYQNEFTSKNTGEPNQIVHVNPNQVT